MSFSVDQVINITQENSQTFIIYVVPRNVQAFPTSIMAYNASANLFPGFEFVLANSSSAFNGVSIEGNFQLQTLTDYSLILPSNSTNSQAVPANGNMYLTLPNISPGMVGGSFTISVKGLLI